MWSVNQLMQSEETLAILATIIFSGVFLFTANEFKSRPTAPRTRTASLKQINNNDSVDCWLTAWFHRLFAL